MDKYFVVQITKTSESEAFATLVTVMNSIREAEMLYHQILAGALATANLEYAQVYVSDYYGNKLPISGMIYPEPTPEPSAE